MKPFALSSALRHIPAVLELTRSSDAGVRTAAAKHLRAIYVAGGSALEATVAAAVRSALAALGEETTPLGLQRGTC